jgi:hypothetical protein
VSSIVVANVELVDTWSRYDVAPVDAFHVKVGFVATPVAPLAGVARTGGAGGVAVVKLNAPENELGTPPLEALTCQ